MAFGHPGIFAPREYDRDTDDFSKELAFFWDIDSLADVEIVQALEQEFHVTITDAEAVAMKTLRDIVLGVHAKLTTQAA